MEYILLIYSSEADGKKRPQAENQQIYQEYMSFRGPHEERQEQGRQSARADDDGYYRSRAQRQDHGDGRAVRRDQGAARRILPRRGEGYRRGHLDCRADSGLEARVDRSAADQEAELSEHRRVRRGGRR